MQSYEIGSLSLTSNGEPSREFDQAEVNQNNSITHQDTQNSSQDYNEVRARKVQKSLEPEIIKEPPSTDRRGGT